MPEEPDVFTLPSTLDLLWEDEDAFCIYKPHNLLVHKTRLAAQDDTSALDILRDQLGYTTIYPAHRLDRKTAGLVLFTKHTEANRVAQALFRERQVRKAYQAIVRGWLDADTIDYAIGEGKDKKEAITHYRSKRWFEIELPSGGHPTSRYALVDLFPETGRYHQLRKHMAHIMHPIIGDRPHGCNKQNRLWKHTLGISDMLLCATGLSFTWHDKAVDISAPLSQSMQWAVTMLEQNDCFSQKM